MLCVVVFLCLTGVMDAMSIRSIGSDRNGNFGLVGLGVLDMVLVELIVQLLVVFAANLAQGLACTTDAVSTVCEAEAGCTYFWEGKEPRCAEACSARSGADCEVNGECLLEDGQCERMLSLPWETSGKTSQRTGCALNTKTIKKDEVAIMWGRKLDVPLSTASDIVMPTKNMLIFSVSNQVMAYANDGAHLWTTSFADEIVSTPSLSPCAEVAVADSNGKAYKLDLDGNIKSSLLLTPKLAGGDLAIAGGSGVQWENLTHVSQSAATDSCDFVFLASSNTQYSLVGVWGPDETRTGFFGISQGVNSNPALRKDGANYLVTYMTVVGKGGVVSFPTTGSLNIDSVSIEQVCSLTDPTTLPLPPPIFISSDDVYWVCPAGVYKHKSKITEGSLSAGTWNSDTKVPFHVAKDGETYSVIASSDPNIQPFKLGDQTLFTHPVSTIDGNDFTIYVIGDQTLYALKGDLSMRWSFSPVVERLPVGNLAPTIAPDGTIYVIMKSTLYCLGKVTNVLVVEPGVISGTSQESIRISNHHLKPGLDVPICLFNGLEVDGAFKGQDIVCESPPFRGETILTVQVGDKETENWHGDAQIRFQLATVVSESEDKIVDPSVVQGVSVAVELPVPGITCQLDSGVSLPTAVLGNHVFCWVGGQSQGLRLQLADGGNTLDTKVLLGSNNNGTTLRMGTVTAGTSVMDLTYDQIESEPSAEAWWNLLSKPIKEPSATEFSTTLPVGTTYRDVVLPSGAQVICSHPSPTLKCQWLNRQSLQQEWNLTATIFTIMLDGNIVTFDETKRLSVWNAAKTMVYSRTFTDDVLHVDTFGSGIICVTASSAAFINLDEDGEPIPIELPLVAPDSTSTLSFDESEFLFYVVSDSIHLVDMTEGNVITRWALESSVVESTGVAFGQNSTIGMFFVTKEAKALLLTYSMDVDATSSALLQLPAMPIGSLTAIAGASGPILGGCSEGNFDLRWYTWTVNNATIAVIGAGESSTCPRSKEFMLNSGRGTVVVTDDEKMEMTKWGDGDLWEDDDIYTWEKPLSKTIVTPPRLIVNSLAYVVEENGALSVVATTEKEPNPPGVNRWLWFKPPPLGVTPRSTATQEAAVVFPDATTKTFVDFSVQSVMLDNNPTNIDAVKIEQIFFEDDSAYVRIPFLTLDGPDGADVALTACGVSEGSIEPPFCVDFPVRIYKCHEWKPNSHPNTNGTDCECDFDFVPASTGSKCTPCPSGTTTRNIGDAACTCRGGYTGQECTACPVNMYKGEMGSVECTACPVDTGTSGLTASNSIDQCVCVTGKYPIDCPEDSTEVKCCRDCVTGELCKGNGQREPSQGYWWGDGTDPERSIYQCRVQAACLGGVDSACSDGYEGLLCYSCQAGYARIGKNCRSCPSDDMSLAMSLAAAIFAICVLVGLVLNTRSSGPKTAMAAKIVLNILQTLGFLGFYHVEWPAPLQVLFEFGDALTFGLDFFFASCLSQANRQTIFIRSFVICCVVILGSLLVLAIAFLIDRTRGGDRQWSSYKTLWVQISVVFMFVFGPQVLKNCVEMMSCIDINGKEVLATDVSVPCNESYILAGAVLIGLFSVLVPLSVGVVLYRSKEGGFWEERFRFLYFGYRKGFGFWEVIVFVRKFVVATAAVLIESSEGQLLFGLSIVFINFTLHMNLRPIESREFHFIEQLNLVFLVLLHQVGLMQTTGAMQVGVVTTLAYVLVVALLGFISYTFMYILLVKITNGLKQFFRRLRPPSERSESLLQT